MKIMKIGKGTTCPILNVVFGGGQFWTPKVTIVRGHTGEAHRIRGLHQHGNRTSDDRWVQECGQDMVTFMIKIVVPEVVHFRTLI